MLYVGKYNTFSPLEWITYTFIPIRKDLGISSVDITDSVIDSQIVKELNYLEIVEELL